MNQGRKLIEEYEINPATVLVTPVMYGSKIFSKIYELDEDCISPFKPIDIVKESCYSFGSNYEGRKAAARRLIGVTHKVPIAISPFIYLFPTASPENPECIWIAHEHIVDYKKGDTSSTSIIKFSNNQLYPLPISTRSLQNQLIRTMMLKSKLSRGQKEQAFAPKQLNKMRGQESAEDREDYRW